ncbi:MAG: caspase family protein [Lewinellaceae bacterium]|nr:caspase family protein [Lewinellaceae bacterium]
MKKWVFFFLFYLVMVHLARTQGPELMIPIGHVDRLSSAKFSPNGQYIITGSFDGSVKLWDLFGRELKSFEGHFDAVNSIDISPDGQFILSGSEDGFLKLWDIKGALIQDFSGHDLAVNTVAFSPNGQYILSGSNDKTARLWDLQGREIKRFSGHMLPVTDIDFSPDGQFILTVSDGLKAKMWNLNGEELQSFEPESTLESLYTAAFSPDGEFILTAQGHFESKGKFKLWDLSGRELFTFNGHAAAINSVSFSPDGSYILSSSYDQTARLWDLEGNELRSFEGHVESVTSAVFSPDGRFILTASIDKTAILWDLQGHKRQIFAGKSLVPRKAIFSPDSKYILTGNDDQTARLWNLHNLEVRILNGHSSYIQSIDFSADGKYILTGSDDRTVKMWDLNGKELQSFSGHKLTVMSAIFSPGGDKIASGSFDSEVKLWNLNGSEIHAFQLDGEPIWSLSFSPDGKQIMIGSDWNGKLMDLAGNEIQRFVGHDLNITSVRFSQNGQYILTGSFDRTARLWKIGDKEEQIFDGHTSYIRSVDLSSDGQFVLTGSTDQTVRLWDRKGVELKRFDGHVSEILSVNFSPDGKYVLSSGFDNTSRIWETSTGRNLLKFIGFSDPDKSWIIISPEDYYASSQKGMKFIYFKIGLQAYNFDQFDLRLNRPDKVLETLFPFGADPALMFQYRQAYYKRLEKYGFTEEMLSDNYHVPACAISNSDQLPISTMKDIVQLQIEAIDSLRLLDRLNVFVNDVPIYGIPGINLRDQNTQDYKTTLDIPLSRGENKIQVSALNQGGAESLKATTYITYDAPERKPNLYLIAIGVSGYQAAGKNLQYAAKDAEDIASWYQSAPGFGQVYAKTLTDGQVTKANILALRSWLEQSQVDDQVLIYASGHGLLDENYDFYYATHDIDFAHPAKKGILYDEIEGLLDGIPARKKLLLIDACHSGEYDADTAPLTQAQQDSLAAKGVAFKGFAKGDEEGAPVLGLQNSFEMMQQLFADLRRGSGATVISSSSGMQFSYEDANWENGAFTYVFLNGLKTMRADANGDGQVTASEIQAYVAEYVPRLTEGLQVPTFRRENLEYDFRVW